MDRPDMIDEPAKTDINVFVFVYLSAQHSLWYPKPIWKKNNQSADKQGSIMMLLTCYWNAALLFGMELNYFYLFLGQMQKDVFHTKQLQHHKHNQQMDSSLKHDKDILTSVKNNEEGCVYLRKMASDTNIFLHQKVWQRSGIGVLWAKTLFFLPPPIWFFLLTQDWLFNVLLFARQKINCWSCICISKILKFLCKLLIVRQNWELYYSNWELYYWSNDEIWNSETKLGALLLI